MASLFEPDVPRRRLAGQFTFFLIWLGVTGVALMLQPNPAGHGTHRQLGLPPCPSVLMFGRPCPGCGMTTSWTATVHGRLAEAYAAHPLGPIAYALVTAAALACGYGFWRGWRLRTETNGFQRALVISLLIFLVYGGYRFWRETGYS